MRLLRTAETVLDSDKGVLRVTETLTDLGRAYDAMKARGLDALPFAIAKIKNGDSSLLPLVHDLTGGLAGLEEGSLAAQIAETLSWWERNQARWTIPPVSAAKLKDAKP